MKDIPEEWAPVEGFPNYVVSNHGRVVNRKFDRELSYRPNSYGHARVVLYSHGKHVEHYVHHLVAMAFIPDYRPGIQIKHIDEDHSNCHVMNLKLRNGRRMRHPRTHPENYGIRRIQIIETEQSFRSVKACADYLKTDVSNIYRVLRGERDRHLGYTFKYIEV